MNEWLIGVALVIMVVSVLLARTPANEKAVQENVAKELYERLKSADYTNIKIERRLKTQRERTSYIEFRVRYEDAAGDPHTKMVVVNLDRKGNIRDELKFMDVEGPDAEAYVRPIVPQTSKEQIISNQHDEILQLRADLDELKGEKNE